MQEEVVLAFQQEYAAELSRLNQQSDSRRPDYEREFDDVSSRLANLKAAILKGIDPSIFVEELNQLQGRQRFLNAELAIKEEAPGATDVILHPGLADIYRAKVAALTAAFEDEALKAEAFEEIRELIDSVVFTPQGDELVIHLRGELASMLALCACSDKQKPPAGYSEGVLQIKLVAGACTGRCTTPLAIEI